MTMSVVRQMHSSGAPFYYSREWRLLVESHLSWLRTGVESEVISLDHQIAYKYEGDLFGALTELKVPEYMHWPILRMNGLSSPTHFNGDAIILMVPQQSVLSSLRGLAETKQRKIA